MSSLFISTGVHYCTSVFVLVIRFSSSQRRLQQHYFLSSVFIGAGRLLTAVTSRVFIRQNKAHSTAVCTTFTFIHYVTGISCVCAHMTSLTSATDIYTIHNRYTPHSIVATLGVPAWTGRTGLPMNIVYVQNLQTSLVPGQRLSVHFNTGNLVTSPAL